ncbi:hypothetical protein ZOSMA_192G00410 [Zostera marina]|uniref:Uncharacterized protein n=1 Tax=Zostera marina TaxID=29655 RepID=A0A0K9PPH0_ZOSMR|nr:hypothetical protein ZOSMA_192G00410 [Zostera marina]
MIMPAPPCKNDDIYTRFDTMKKKIMARIKMLSQMNYFENISSSGDISLKPPRLFTAEEVLIGVNTKGNVFDRIARLGDRVIKIEEVMKRKRRKRKKKKKKGDCKEDIIINHQKKNLVEEKEGLSKLYEEKCENPLIVDETTKDFRTLALVHKILDMGTFEKPSAAGFGFDLGLHESCEGTTFFEENVIKRVFPMINFWKLKRLDKMEIKRLLSIQGIITYTFWEMRETKPMVYV